MDRDSADIHDTETELDDDDLDDDCFLEDQSSQDTKSLRWKIRLFIILLMSWQSEDAFQAGLKLLAEQHNYP